jgi:D-alanine-D-alanine ligase
LGVSCIDYEKHSQFEPFLTHDSKWRMDSLEYKMVMPSLKSVIKSSLRRKIIDTAFSAAKVLGCRGYLRVDMREKDSNIYVLDINPNPDINKDSGFARQAANKGYSYEGLIEKIIFLALKRRA